MLHSDLWLSLATVIKARIAMVYCYVTETSTTLSYGTQRKCEPDLTFPHPWLRGTFDPCDSWSIAG